jgi:hypothetical protein
VTDIEDPAEATPRGRGFWIAVGSAVLALLLIVVAVFLGAGGRATVPSADPSSTGDAGRTSSPTAVASASPSPTNSGPTPEPTVDPNFGEPVVDEVGTDGQADFGGDVSARIISITPYAATASQAGEVSGPAVLVELELLNESGDALPLDPVTVNAYYGADRIPASPVTSDPASAPFTGTLESGATARGSYVFSVVENEPVTVTVSKDATSGLVVFR